MSKRFNMVRVASMAALAAALVAGPAVAADGYFGWAASGTTYEVGPQHYFFVGAFTGMLQTEDASSPLNNAALQCPGSLSIGINGGGYCVYTDGAGDKLFTQWTCDGAVATPPGAIAALNCTNTITGGTGKYDGATGGNTFVGVTQFAHPDGVVSGYSVVNDMSLTLKGQ